jgi:hypothetical protein
VYHLTAPGQQALQKWIEGDEAAHPPERDAELVRFLFLDRSDFEVIQGHALRHRAHYAARLAHWRSERDSISQGTHERMQDRLAKAPASEHGFVTGMKWFAFDGLVRRAEMEVEWAEAVLTWLQGLGGTKRNGSLPKGALTASATTATPKPRKVRARTAEAARPPGRRDMKKRPGPKSR